MYKRIHAAVDLVILFVFSSGYTVSQDAVSAVRPESAYSYCRILAGKDFEGRFTGSPGYAQAARWAAAEFKKWGLQPLFDGQSYLQDFPSPYSIIDQTELSLKIPGKPGVEGKTVAVELFKDFLPLLFSDSGEAEADLVFAGWGISAPELGYDDYAGMDVRDKFVVCYRGVPDPTNLAFTEHDQHRTRMRLARDKGAQGLFYIYEEVQANPNGDRLAGFMPLEISTAVADMILTEKGLSSANLRGDLSRYQRPLSFPLKTRARLKVAARYFPDGIGHNIGAYLEGSDPQLRGELIVLGAHFDHCGQQAGRLFPGADDNASGSATVMEAARVLAKSGSKPRRSIAFTLFGGEEMGLLGSNWLVKKGPYQGKRFSAMLNFDMTGEGDGLGCGFSAEPTNLKQMIEAAGARLSILVKSREIRSVGVRGSDYAPFFQNGVPIVSLVSNGPHVFYHQAGDTLYRVNPDMLADAARFGISLALELANR